MSRGRRLAIALALAATAAAGQEVAVSGSNTVRAERYDSSGNAPAPPTRSPPARATTSSCVNFALAAFGLRPLARPRGRRRERLAVPLARPGRGARAPRARARERRGGDPLPRRGRRLLRLHEPAHAAAPAEGRRRGAAARPRAGRRPHLDPRCSAAPRRTAGGTCSGDDDNTVGLSWLAELGAWRFTANALRNARDASARRPGSRGASQTVASLAADVPFELGGDALARGGRGRDAARRPRRRPARRTTGGTSATAASSRSCPARSRGSTLAWRLRGERYGAGLPALRRGGHGRPSRRGGAPVVDASASFLSWRARLQDFRDGYETDNPLRTRVAGLAASGPVQALGGSLNLDVFRQIARAARRRPRPGQRQSPTRSSRVRSARRSRSWASPTIASTTA